MGQVYANPQEIRNFQAALRQFNSEMSSATSRIHAQLQSLGTSWRDQEYSRFSQELEEVLRTFDRYLQSSDGYIRHLDMKAAPLEGYLGR